MMELGCFIITTLNNDIKAPGFKELKKLRLKMNRSFIQQQSVNLQAFNES
jgi:hypothetical protein